VVFGGIMEPSQVMGGPPKASEHIRLDLKKKYLKAADDLSRQT